MNATINLEKNHFPVLLNELISIISPLYGGTFIDCTLGQGGYSKEILKTKLNKVIALDRDPDVLQIAKKIEIQNKNRFNFFNSKFSEIDKLNIKDNDLKAIIFDLGYSLNQILDFKKGLSFQSTGKLDMRLGLNHFSCDDVISNISEKSLNKIFKIFGEEKNSKLIAKKIIQNRNKKKLKTEDLVKIVAEIKKYKFSRTNPSTKIFQALRIYINKEISELINGLIYSFKILPIGGMIVVVTFHSIEDKIVKFFFKNYSDKKNSSRYAPSIEKNNCLKLENNKPIIPSADEIKINPASRSAKLRYAIKTNENDNFDELHEKFNYLIETENLNYIS